MGQTLRYGFIVEYVEDIERARKFFSETMGLQITREHPTFIQFADDAGVNFAVATDVPVGSTGAPEIYWVVDDVDRAFERLSRDAEVAIPPRQMPFGTVFAINDLDGQPHYVVQFAGERPSQAVE